MPSELLPEVRAMLDQFEAAPVPPVHGLAVEEAREQHRTNALAGRGDPEPVGRVQDLRAPGPDDEPLPLRIYAPNDDGPHPVVVWYHGGGFVLGDLDVADEICRALTNATGCLVVSVDYRLAPEHPFPAGVRDAYAAVEWVAEHADSVGGDPDRIAVAGDSAGGALAAVAALVARNRGGPDLAHQALVYPVTSSHGEWPSYAENGEGYGLERQAMEWFDEQYVDRPIDRRHPYAYPLQARNLIGLPSATVLTAEFDPLRDEGAAYANRLREAGVPVEHHNYDGVVHGFFTQLSNPELTRAREAIEEVAGTLRSALDAD